MSPSSQSGLDDDELLAAVERFAGRRILVWGDFVADRFLHGSTTRVSREAPALVLRHEREEIRPGGAGNAALNAAALGARVTVCGFVGDDPAGSELRESLAAAGIDTAALAVRADAPTPVKTRVMAGGRHTVRQQILRIDQESPWRPIDDVGAVADRLAGLAGAADGVLISDYGLGTVSPESTRLWIGTRPEIPTVLDSRYRLLEFPGVTAATPNEAEAAEALRADVADDDDIAAAGRAIVERLGCRHLLITRGSSGMSVFDETAEPVHLDAHGTSDIADVTGAGDTVIAAFTLGLVAGCDALSAARIANAAAGLAVLKHGTAAVSNGELVGALRRPA